MCPLGPFDNNSSWIKWLTCSKHTCFLHFSYFDWTALCSLSPNWQYALFLVISWHCRDDSQLIRLKMTPLTTTYVLRGLISQYSTFKYNQKVLLCYQTSWGEKYSEQFDQNFSWKDIETTVAFKAGLQSISSDLITSLKFHFKMPLWHFHFSDNYAWHHQWIPSNYVHIILLGYYIMSFKNSSLGADSIKRCHLTSIGNPIVEIRRS